MHPILFQVGSLTIYTYGVFMALALIIVFAVAMERSGCDAFIGRDMVADLVFLLFVSGVLGARLFYVIQHFGDYRDRLWQVFWIREGGLVWYGGFLGAASAGMVYAYLRRWPILRLCDFFSPLVPLGHAFGRLGCFFNGCCYGRITGSAFGVVFEGDSFRRLPIQLYESGLLLGLSFFLFFLSAKKHRAGEIFIFYLIGYSLLRFFAEYFRGDQMVTHFLTVPQWMSFFLLLGALFLMWIIRRGGMHRLGGH